MILVAVIVAFWLGLVLLAVAIVAQARDVVNPHREPDIDLHPYDERRVRAELWPDSGDVQVAAQNGHAKYGSRR